MAEIESSHFDIACIFCSTEWIKFVIMKIKLKMRYA